MDQWAAPEGMSDVRLPAAFIDLDRLDANLRYASGVVGTEKQIRWVTKSLRVPALYQYLRERRSCGGLMTFNAQETRWLSERQPQDLLLAYPLGSRADADDVVRAARRVKTRVVIDQWEQVEAMLSFGGAQAGVGAVIDVDVALSLFGRHLGVRRSGLKSASQVVDLASRCRESGIDVVGVMAYESLVAGINPMGVHWGVRPVFRALAARSMALAIERRAEIVEALRREGFSVDLVNGGGSRSLRWSSADPSITEVAVGSLLLKPHSFDDLVDLQPALWFGLPVSRSAGGAWSTCNGGGYVASGSGTGRAPRLVAPDLQISPDEGWGEVQTPIRHIPGRLTWGDAVFARPAKSGELLNYFDVVHVVRDGRVVDRWKTYRGVSLPT